MSVDLSIIVPVYNEEDNVLPMYEAIRDAVAPIERTIELVFVDDGSRDRTVERLSALPRQGKPAVRIVKFRRNYGQTQAMMAGIDVARGKVLVTMDGDLQNDPRDIPRFLEQIEAGHDLVVGWRKDRKDHWSRVLPSKVANRLIGWVTGVPIKDNG
jgi:glycosyltransferase involved in cell wall biosynthesis